MRFGIFQPRNFSFRARQEQEAWICSIPTPSGALGVGSRGGLMRFDPLVTCSLLLFPIMISGRPGIEINSGFVVVVVVLVIVVVVVVVVTVVELSVEEVVVFQ